MGNSTAIDPGIVLIIVGVLGIGYGLYSVITNRISVGFASFTRNLVGQPAKLLGSIYAIAGLTIIVAGLLLQTAPPVSTQPPPELLAQLGDHVKVEAGPGGPNETFAAGLFIIAFLMVLLGNLYGVSVSRQQASSHHHRKHHH